ncbi:MAG TPA: Ig-like domain-containing protein [Lacunisphaera sp.]|nr:Ig-like domain-containing protein [Lacunisphaera sp.]
MSLKTHSPAWWRAVCLVLVLAGVAASPVLADPPPAPGAAEMIVGTKPQRVTAEGEGVHGQLEVAQELISPDTSGDLVYTITVEPLFGQVGLAGGNEEDFFQNKSGSFGYFAYKPREGYVGEDSFTYTVRNVTSGLVFQNKVMIDVKPPPPVVLDKFVITKTRTHDVVEHTVALNTKPNLPVTQKLPSHEDYLAAAERAALVEPKVTWALDEKAKPGHGTARLNPATGELNYAPDPGFIGEDRFNYYTVDENNPQLGVENAVVVSVEPIREMKHIVADRSKSRQVDLVFVINNSRSMAPHQARIAENLRRFRQLFDEKKLDYRIGVLTTDFVNAEAGSRPGAQHFFKEVRGAELDAAGRPVLDRRGRPKQVTKQVASNGDLVTLPELPQPWVTPATPDSVFAELVKVGTNGDSNRTAFTAVYNLVANYQHGDHAFFRPDATTIVVFFMDEEETRMATWKDLPGGGREAEWVENGRLPALLNEYNASHPQKRQTLDSYINFWVLRPFIIIKGNKRGQIEMDAVVEPANVSHRRAAELTGGTVLNIEGDFSAPLAALGDRIADTVAVALDPVAPGATLYRKSLRVRVDGQDVKPDPENGWVYDDLTHSIRFNGAAKKQAFEAKIDITYEEHR